MPGLTKSELLGRFTNSLAACGWMVTFPPPPHTHPYEMFLSRGDEIIGVLLYIWNITHGGNHRPADEYRIQITGVDTIARLPSHKTLILGYRDDPPVFAGWDADFHSKDIAKSPSLQIRQAYLDAANASGFAACPKEQGEVAIAFRPDLLPTYIRILEGLHASGSRAEEVSILTSVAASDGEVDDDAVAELPTERQLIVKQVAERYRDASFRQRVLTAYGFRCAVCGVQMDLVDAAHILPVSDERSSDATCNGIALCALHHRSYDRALIGVFPDYTVKINPEVLSYLRESDRIGGETDFMNSLYRSITLPPERLQRPPPSLLRAGLEIRGWSL